jgi:hypothetical protein
VTGPVPAARHDPGRAAVPEDDGAARVRAALLTPAGRALVARLTPWDEARALATLAAVRREPEWAAHPAVVAAAASQARLRTRAVERFPGPPRWWTADSLEQATRPAVAVRHAARFAAAGVREVADLGCGAGSDALALAGAGLAVLAVDRDPAALWALAATAADRDLPITTLAADVRAPGHWWNAGPVPAGAGCFVDPARRRGGTRRMLPQDWSPPWSWVVGLAQRVPATGAKVAPGLDHALLPADAQAEWVSVGGTLVEAGVWWGPLRQGGARRVATVLRGTTVEHLDDAAGVPEPAVGGVGAWLVEPDPAVIRSGLVGVLADRVGGRLLDPRIAYVSADAQPQAGVLGARYAVLDEAPFARKALRAWLRSRGFADVVVKKRGVAVVPEQLRAALRLEGSGPVATLVLTRTAAGPLALLVAPDPVPASPPG